MLPWLQALGGIGAGWLIARAAGLNAPARFAMLAGIAAWAALSVGRMSVDLYREFPTYAAGAWGYGTRQAVLTLEGRRAGHDDVLVDTGEKLIGSLILFYTRLDPSARHAEVLGLQGRSERSRVGDYRIGPLDEAMRRPGRHLVWTTADRAARLSRSAEHIGSVPLPDGRGHYGLLSVSGGSGIP